MAGRLRVRACPASLVKTSLNDSQVMYWEPAKYVAKMRALNAGAPGRYDYLREIAFDYAWVLKEPALS